jgi:hypothetical protein
MIFASFEEIEEFSDIWFSFYFYSKEGLKGF